VNNRKYAITGVIAFLFLFAGYNLYSYFKTQQAIQLAEDQHAEERRIERAEAAEAREANRRAELAAQQQRDDAERLAREEAQARRIAEEEVRRIAAEEEEQQRLEQRNNDRTLQKAIVDKFGNEVAREDGRINRPARAQIVFKDAAKLATLEELIHPVVRQEIHKYINLNDSKVVVIEAIKLLEGSLKQDCQQIWVANCERQRQLDRLLICRGMDQETAEMRLNSQAPQADKVAQADVVIDTGSTMADTRKQVMTA